MSAAADDLICAFRRNIVVAASAGTGKTHRLTSLYVLLTLGLTSMGQSSNSRPADPVTPDRILATTFSRAAALEIRARVEDALQRVATWDGESKLPFEAEIRKRHADLGMHLDAGRLKRLAGQALDRFALARIDTLHGVAAQIARSHALELGLPPRARVLEQDEAQALAEVAIDDALGAALRAGGGRARAARSLIAACSGVEGTRQAVLRMLDRLDEEGLTPSSLSLFDHAEPVRLVGEELLRVLANAAAGGSDTIRKPAALAFAALRPANGQIEISEDAVTQLVALFKVRKPRSRAPADDDFFAFRDALPRGTNLDRAYALLALLREAPELRDRERGLVGVVEHAREILIASRLRGNALGFGDLLRAARDGLRDLPAVLEGVQGGLDVLLVDEFQDTSRVQRDLVYLLRERKVHRRAPGASPLASDLVGHGLFLVGDRKQSIYGFRGADVAVFARICAELAGSAAGEALELPRELWNESPVADFVALSESRRSSPAIVSFVNTFATRDFAGRSDSTTRRDFDVAYAPAEHLVAHPDNADQPGSVVVVQDDGVVPEGADPLLRDERGPARESFIAAAYVAREMRLAPQTGARLAYRDIAILARRRSTIGLVELALSRWNIPYVVAGRALYDAREIRDVAALLRLLLDPSDRLGLATVLRGPIVGLSDRSLAALSSEGRGLRLAAVGLDAPRPQSRKKKRPESTESVDLPAPERARLDAFCATFAAMRRTALRITPAEAIRHAVTGFELDRILAALPRPEARIGNVDRLVSIARKQGGTLGSFVRWLDKRIADESDEPEAAVFSEDDDAVRLTTIHASKGLDFPVVVLVDLNAEPRAGVPGVSFLPERATNPATLVVKHVGSHPLRLPGSQEAELGGSSLPLAIRTTLWKEAWAEADARERAERCRITYVAMTRPRNQLVLIGPKHPPRRGSAWTTLATMLETEQLPAADPTPTAPAASTPSIRTETASALWSEPSEPLAARVDANAVVDPPLRPAVSTARSLTIATTPLGLFRGCARRFRLRHLLGVDEPVDSGQLDLFAIERAAREPDETPMATDDLDPRSLGRAMHRVLFLWPAEGFGRPTSAAAVEQLLVREGLGADDAETKRIATSVAGFIEGPYAKRMAAEGTRLLREEEFVLEVQPTSIGPVASPALFLRGAMDLLVEHADGTIDVIDYKRSPPRSDLSPYEFQLRSYALAAHRRYPGRPIRAGLVFLGVSATAKPTATEPSFLCAASPGSDPTRPFDETEHQAFEQDLARLAATFAAARYDDRWDPVPIESCKKQHCGFITACYPQTP